MDRIRRAGRRIADRFHPDRVVLFGSYAEGTADEGSDVDLLIILSFKERPFRKAIEIQDYLNPDFACDVVVRRPEDVARRYAEGDPLIREALDRGKVLYERHGAGVGRQG
jgi:predicted nucleotidyltransferase